MNDLDLQRLILLHLRKQAVILMSSSVHSWAQVVVEHNSLSLDLDSVLVAQDDLDRKLTVTHVALLRRRNQAAAELTGIC